MFRRSQSYNDAPGTNGSDNEDNDYLEALDGSGVGGSGGIDDGGGLHGRGRGGLAARGRMLLKRIRSGSAGGCECRALSGSSCACRQ